MLQGIVKFYDKTKGFGVIRSNETSQEYTFKNYDCVIGDKLYFGVSLIRINEETKKIAEIIDVAQIQKDGRVYLHKGKVVLSSGYNSISDGYKVPDKIIAFTYEEVKLVWKKEKTGKMKNVVKTNIIKLPYSDNSYSKSIVNKMLLEYAKQNNEKVGSYIWGHPIKAEGVMRIQYHEIIDVIPEYIYELYVEISPLELEFVVDGFECITGFISPSISLYGDLEVEHGSQEDMLQRRLEDTKKRITELSAVKISPEEQVDNFNQKHQKSEIFGLEL